MSRKKPGKDPLRKEWENRDIPVVSGRHESSEKRSIDSSDLLFLEALLQDSVEYYPKYIWLWDECKPANEHFH